MATDGGRYAGHDLLDARGLTLTDGARPDDEFVAFAEAETEHSVPDRFEIQADKFPDRIAVRTASREFTYDALNRTANRIAQAILAVDAEGEQRVALLLEQSDPLLAASILGILKAAKIYVPIDPSYPPARTTYVLEDSQAALIVTGSSNLSLARELAGNERHVLNVDEISPELCDENPGLRAGPDSIAYIIYTSGSTGQPKGVVHTHRNLLRYIRNYTNSWRIRPSDRLTLFFSPSFSQSLMDIFSALLKGAALHPYDVKQEGLADLAPWLIGEGITVFDSVPTLYRHFLDNLTGKEEFPDLRLIRLGGEPVTREIVARTRKHFPGRLLLNQLAATEASMIAQYSVDSETEMEGSTVPAGYPVDGVEVLVIDDTGAEIGFGRVGEIVVKSRFLSSGYWRKPALTQAAFRSDPHGGGRRLYHTGDLGRLRSDGCLEFLGRKDSRVKVRGHSIEVAEIEAALFDLGDAKEVAVTAQELGQDDLRLVAYMVPRNGSLPSVSSMRTALAQTLPDYMIPSTFVSLPALPMTPNGKLDRRALPVPDEERPDLESAYVAPRMPVEEALAAIWAEILGLERVGVHDDFFELGGHSLLATRVVSRVRETFQVELPLRSLFEEPTVAGLAERIEEARRVEQSSSARPVVPVPRDRDARLPLSFSQQWMWLVEQLEPGTSTYNTTKNERLTGRLDITALERSLEEMVRRHEALRTTFAVVDGTPVQVITPARALEVPLIDLSELPQAEREAEARRLAREEARLPFDLERGPLFRAKLLRLGEEEHVLLLTTHHIVSDGWSMGVVRRELKAHYEAFSEGKPSPLAELPIQYADYAIWQREWLAGETLEEQLDYWRRQLADVPALELPIDRPRPAVRTHRGARQELVLPESLTESLKALGRRDGATLFMVLLGTLQVLLSRYSGQEDVAVGTPIAGRNRAETEGLIGFFVNNLVMRTDLSGDPSFRELLGRVREVCLGAYAHQDLPFNKLVEELKPERDRSRTPFFQVFLNLLEVDDAPIELNGLRAERIVRSDDQSMFDLALFVTERHEGLHLKFVYNADLFEAAMIERMVGHFRTLLEGTVADPERRVSELELLTEEERRQLVVEWNDTRAEYPEKRCVHELFEEQAERNPDALAVVFEDEQLTYRELNRRANRLAHHLRGLGVGPEVLVGICLERSVEMVVGLLGVLKAGGAYVPLDPAYPKERLSFTLKDAQVPVLLTQRRLLEELPEHGARVVCLEANWEEIAGESDENPAGGAAPDNLAYIIYTSGSTGVPKGVMIEHRALSGYVSAAVAAYEITASDRVLQFAPLNFDASVEEIFPSLVCGSTLVLRSDRMVDSMQRFVRECRERAISVLSLPTAFWHELVLAFEEEKLALPPTVRLMIIGGEKALAPRVAQWHAHLAQVPRSARLLNTYGPTEATVVATACDLRPESGSAHLVQSEVPIGRPLGDTQVYILDKHLNPVPISVPGELHIGGPGVARGYLNRPALTEKKFVSHPFIDAPEARLYKTGDLARYRPNGDIEFLGRTDFQVKIRGFRVEPGEVESVLNEHAAVRESVVLLREDAPDQKRLAAYVVPTGVAPSPGELRAFLRQKLPTYMVPSAFVILEALPLTPTGKVDRRVLPAPDLSSFRGDSTHFVAPRTPVEEALAEIWADVLRLEQVGAHSDFFELGGHSLLATQIVSRVREVFQVELPVRSLFEEPTVAGLAERIEEARRVGQSHSAPPLAPVPRDARLPLSFGQQRLWFLHQLEPEDTSYKMAFARRLMGTLDVRALKDAIAAIVVRHEVLRTRFEMVDGEPVQVIAPTLDVPLTVEDLANMPKTEREAEALRRAREEAGRPYDLERGPLFRARLLRLAEEEHVLIPAMHHIVSDGWSMGVFWRELGALYKAFSEGKPSPLAELPIQYADYAVWQRQWLTGEVLEEQLDYWRRQLADVPALELPTDRPRPAIQTHRGARQEVVLPESLTQGLKDLSRREGATLFMMLLAAFQVLLSRYSDQDDIAVGTPIAGRKRTETEGLIGFFVNTLVMRTDLSGDSSFRELLSRVRETALDAYAHQDLNFEKLVEELKPKRDLSRHPLFQVMFQLNSTSGRAQNLLPGLMTERQEVKTGTAKFDLTLSMVERPDGLRISFVYNTDLFDLATIGRMLSHFRTLLESIVADPERRVSELELLSEEERHRLLVEWNDTRAEYPEEWCVHELFEEQAERNPDALAVVFEDEQLTYRELNAQANRLAHHLRGLGVGPEVLVGICLERGVDLVVALLATLKAGGAYVPLDPNYPPERLAFMLEDTAAAVLITETRLVEGLRTFGGELLCLDADAEAVARHPDDNPQSQATPNNLAYVIYTSGSTGLPKGVMVEHGNLTSVHWAWSRSYPGRNHTWLSTASFSFDVFSGDVLRSICSGGRLVICPTHLLSSPEDLSELITGEGVDALEGTPSVLAQLIQHSNNTGRSLERLAFLIAGSETWQVSDFVAARRACGPGVRIFNSYGVTEATIDSVLFEVDEEKIGSNSQVPIGWPIANTEVFVLDAHRNPVPVGVPGELYVGGAGLARSYLNQPEITTERFVAHPFSNRSGARLYKTGDLVRYRPDGNLEFLGRLDEQVKVRGVRIEPGEVEAALVQHPKVRQGVVVAREDEPDDKRLVAYIVPAADTTPPPSELRAFLREKLPDYMVPTAFVVLDELPLTPNGKVDRRALPVPEGLRTQLENKFVAPCGTLEERLAGIWSEVLGVDWVGAHSDFFELGGHSLLAVSLFARIEKTFGQRLPLATVFQAPTVGQLADVLRRKGEGAPWSSLVAIQPHGSRPPFFCVHGWGDQVLIFHALAQHLGPDQPFYGLQAPDQDAEGIVSSKIKEMAASYVRELREVQPEGPYFLGGHSVGGVVALEMAQQLHTQGQDVALLAMFDTTRPNYLKASNRRQRTKQALSSYEAQSYPGRITLFRVARPKFDTAYPDEPYLGWDSVATGGVEMHKVRGRHRSMLREPYVRGLAEQLKTCLEQARTNSS